MMTIKMIIICDENYYINDDNNDNDNDIKMIIVIAIIMKIYWLQKW